LGLLRGASHINHIHLEGNIFFHMPKDRYGSNFQNYLFEETKMIDNVNISHVYSTHTTIRNTETKIRVLTGRQTYRLA